MSKAGNFWYNALIILVLGAISIRVCEYFNGAPFKIEHIFDFFVYILAVLLLIHKKLEVKKKITQFKKELNVQGEYTFEDLLQLKLEKDYQNKKAQTIKTEQ